MPISRHRRRRGRGTARVARSAADLSITRPRKRKTNKLYLAAAVIIAVLVIGSFGLTTLPFGGGGAARTGSASEYQEGIGVAQPIVSSDHVPTGQTVDHASFPPTSGDHWPPGEQARCGFYKDGIPDERAVHNLEHGNIVVSYHFSDQAQVDQLRRVVDDIGLANAWGITRLYDKIPEDQVALAAWGVLDVMDGIDEDRIARFFDTYSGTLGPEQVPC